MTPWDWRQAFELKRFDVWGDDAGQPQVRWQARVRGRAEGEEHVVDGHVQVRWSHGRFGKPPEAKVYLDTPHHRRSEEHTSELQSLMRISYAVFCLKKKKNKH